MSQQNFDHDIIQTLELCLTKMSQNLKSNFDPYDKLSIQLLKQFRSTISTYHTYLKQIGKTMDSFSKSIRPNNATQNKPIQDNQPKTKTPPQMQSVNMQDNKFTRLLNRHKYNLPTPTPNNPPSGLLMNPG